MTILLDTSVIIDALRRRFGRDQLLQKPAEDGSILACSAVSVAELYARMKPEEEHVTSQLLQGLECIEIGCDLAQRAGALKYAWGRRGRTIGLLDVMIAEAARTFGLKLATDNRKDFPMIPDEQFLDLPSVASQ